MGGNGHKSHTKEYLIVFVILGVLTVIELLVPGLSSLSQGAKTASLIFLATLKAFFVAFYYMHLKDETKWMRFIAAIPISAGFYATVLVLESIYR